MADNERAERDAGGPSRGSDVLAAYRLYGRQAVLVGGAYGLAVVSRWKTVL